MALRTPNMVKMLERFGLTDDATHDIEALYLCWIYGVSLPKLAIWLNGNTSNIAATTIFLTTVFRQRYGNNATTPFSKSLLRSLAEDYPQCPETERFIRRNLKLEEPPKGYVATQSRSLPVKPIYGSRYWSQSGLQNITRYEAKTWTSPEMLDALGLQPNNGRKVVTNEEGRHCNEF